MKFIFNIISLFIIIVIAFLATLNTHTAIDFTVWGTRGVNDVTYHISIVYVILLVLVAGMLAGSFWFAHYYLSLMAKLKEYKRKLEKNSVSVESESSRVAVLESKIEVLEKALKSALEKNNQ